MYKFSELGEAARKVAVSNYIKGWEETHPIDDMNYDDAYSSCEDIEDEVFYNLDGSDYV